MPQVSVGGPAYTQQEFRDKLLYVLDQAAPSQRRLVLGILVGDVRTKAYPENPIAGQPTRVRFVANVKLIGMEGQPIVVDALMSNQAQQLITGSSADGTPVTVEIAASGTVTIIARAAYNRSTHSVSYHTVADLDGQEMEYVFGLRIRNFDDLDVILRGLLNAWRIALGKAPFVYGLNSKFFLDPQVDYHGETYFQGYIGPDDGGRFQAALLGLTCSEVTTYRDWYDSGPWLSYTPVTGSFQAGETVTDGSGSATLVEIITDTTVMRLSGVTGVFTVGATVTGVTSGATALITGFQAEDLNTPDWWYTSNPNGFGEGADPWYASYLRTVCV